MKVDKYATEIRKTGFVLESKVGDMLRRSGWTVISNKYYEDDFEGSVREIDVLAYKVSKIQHVSVYTTLLISCKKNDVDVWALLAKHINLNNPNADWWPLHAWNNDKAVSYEMLKSDMAQTYHQAMAKLGVKEALAVPEYEVFAFQEMNRVSGAPHNDKNIFGAVTSLMKAQAYEIGALQQRKKKPSIYQFNLISIIESDLIRLVIDGNNITQEQIESEHYISRYIIKKREIFSRIRFIVSSSFGECLKDYGRLHKANCKWFDQTINNFYDSILEDSERTQILIDEFRSKVSGPIYLALKGRLDFQGLRDFISIEWNKKGRYAEVTFPEIDLFVESLNQDLVLRKKISTALDDIYRYQGDFQFALDNIPF